MIIFFRIVHGKTGEIKYIRGKGKVELDANGNTKIVFGTNWDVSKEMKVAEEREKALNKLKHAQAQMIQSEKMASLGVLTAGAAHEINNPLNYIAGASNAISKYMINSEKIEKEKLDEYLNWINTGVERINNIVRSLNRYSERTVLKNECNIHEIIEDCLLFITNRVQERITIVKKLTEEKFIVEGNDADLRQAILNILLNAVEAIPDRGNIKIETKVKGNKGYLQIIDSGVGIAKDDLLKITDPFYTTKPAGQGTGLGLTISNTVVQEHKGNITIESVVKMGTTISVTLPCR